MLKVLILAAESAPLVKVGGLGDVVGALPRALRALGHDVRVALPHYPLINSQTAWLAIKPAGAANVQWKDDDSQPAAVTAPVHEALAGDVIHYLIGGPYLPPDSGVYGTGIDQDGPKFIFYSMAALAWCAQMNWQPDVVHVHDSHPGAAVYWLGTKGRRDKFWRRTGTALTIHNLPFQNNHAKKYLALAGLRPSRYPRLPHWAKDGLMGLAIAHADQINAVSPGYAAEIMGEEYGAGLDGLLRARARRVRGILNGLDYEQADPSADPALPVNFDSGSLDRRLENKIALQAECGLKRDAAVPLVGVVSRLDHQKGFDIAAPAVRALLEEGAAQFVLLGAGAPEIQAQFEPLPADFPGAASVNLRFDAALANRIYGGCDIFLMPSRYEPCGTSQMVALRYGAVPAVRATGGLVDTVQNYRAGRGTGFVFKPYSSAALLRALRKALAVYADRDEWRSLQQRGMAVRFTWKYAAEKYAAMYERAVAGRHVDK